MNGPEHYREAERILDGIGEQGHALLTAMASTGNTGKIDMAARAVAAVVGVAQVHAMLALTAATAAEQATAYDGDETHARSRSWSGVA